MQKKEHLSRPFIALTGLRAILLFWVMFIHTPVHFIWNGLINIHQNWGLGVDGFLALSGFLVMRSLDHCDKLAHKNGQPRRAVVQDFMMRRISRILPPYRW